MVDSLLMRTMWSLGLSPARMAGVSGMGFLTKMRPLRSISMTIPRPPNLPCVVVRMSL